MEVPARGEPRTSVPIFFPIFFILVAIYLWLAPFPAHADKLGEGLAQVGFGVMGTITIAAFGVPSCVISGAMVKRALNDEHLSWQWQAAGWIFGVLNGAVGTFYIIQGDRLGIETSLIVGISHVAIGALGIGVTIWGSCIPEEKGVTISPMVLPPPRGVEVGEPAFGLVLSGRF
jgi:hypothetical protein